MTFDDGPSASTPAVLDLMAAHVATATFFVVGSAAANDPGMVRSIAAAGHQVAGHTWSHVDLRYLAADRWDEEVGRTNALLEDLTGQPVTCVWPPCGGADATVRARLADRGLLATTTWSLDTLDWRRPGSDVIASRAIAGLAPGAVVLMHDDGGGDRSQTVAALGAILDAAEAQGYRFVHACR